MIAAADESTPARSLTTAMWAVFAVFFLNGFNFASWASRLPAVRSGLDFSKADMGLLLLFIAVGSILALPLSGLVVQRLGAPRAVVGFAAVNTAGLIAAVVGVSQGAPMIVRAGLFLAGIGTGVWDAAMNLEGAAVEQHLGKAIMPRFHAGFSFGTVAGAGVGGLAAVLDAPLAVHLAIALAISLVAVVWCVRFFLPTTAKAGVIADPPPADAEGAASVGRDFAQPPPAPSEPVRSRVTGSQPEAVPGRTRTAINAWTEPRTLLIGVVVLAAALTEGAANDWVGLAIVDGFKVGDSVGAFGLAIFLAAMTSMRLLGTGLLDRFGRVFVLRLSAGLAGIGIVLFTLVPYLPVALVGVAIWGTGAALGFPVGMSAASDDPVRAASRVSVVATIGYSAFFMGPPLIGLLAEQVGYQHALLVIAVPIALGLLVAGAARPLPTAVGSRALDTSDGPMSHGVP